MCSRTEKRQSFISWSSTTRIEWNFKLSEYRSAERRSFAWCQPQKLQWMLETQDFLKQLVPHVFANVDPLIQLWLEKNLLLLVCSSLIDSESICVYTNSFDCTLLWGIRWFDPFFSLHHLLIAFIALTNSLDSKLCSRLFWSFFLYPTMCS